jgi:hypothetical protein
LDLAFIRNQIELKLKEGDSLLNLYVEGIEKEFKGLVNVIDVSEKESITELVSELKSYSESLKELSFEFGITVAQLAVHYNEIIKSAKAKIEEKNKSRTTTFENVTIIRQELEYSQLADSVGYDQENKLMDIGYSSGSIYRYYNVPLEYFESLKLRNNLKGFKKEIAIYETKKIN